MTNVIFSLNILRNFHTLKHTYTCSNLIRLTMQIELCCQVINVSASDKVAAATKIKRPLTTLTHAIRRTLHYFCVQLDSTQITHTLTRFCFSCQNHYSLFSLFFVKFHEKNIFRFLFRRCNRVSKCFVGFFPCVGS